MPARRVRRLRARTRQGLRTTAIAVAAVAALTASQAPGAPGAAGAAGSGPGRPAADEERTPAAGAVPYTPAAGTPGDGSYHTELPPLITTGTPLTPRQETEVRAESGIPGTVLRAYRAAERSVARTDPGCRLPWQLLAAIGKVESGQARGGAVDRQGTTLGRITGPALDGRGFALVRDTDGGVYDGDKVYDRAVGPMQFLPSTWAGWGADGNGDGRADPDNVFDAALAAGHYLCAGDRDLGRAADLDRAVLSYNDSRAYLDLVRYWLDFYRRGVHSVPDGKGVIPKSPGAGGDTPATKPVDSGGAPGGSGGGGGGIVVDPGPGGPSGPVTPVPSRPHPAPPTGPSSPAPSPTGSQEPSQPGSPSPDPSGSSTADPSPTSPTPQPSGPTAPGGSASPSSCPSSSASSSPDATGQPAAQDPADGDATADPSCPPGQAVSG
ncbi:lytic transglycosylase domain-containing protein [Streptomyces sp. NPDC006743]|uniref:lytic transglycosylase domain-containing protein n=1 Tax=Streptomyces sp. NPDC006743 TaxID=3154480 RepID=UPI0034571BF5